MAAGLQNRLISSCKGSAPGNMSCFLKYLVSGLQDHPRRRPHLFGHRWREVHDRHPEEHARPLSLFQKGAYRLFAAAAVRPAGRSKKA